MEEAIPAISLMLVLSCSSAMVYNGQMASFVCSTSGMSMNRYEEVLVGSYAGL